MKRILLVSLILVAMLLSACGTAVTPIPTPTPTPTPIPIPIPTPIPIPIPTPTLPLEYRELDSFTTEAVKDVRGRAAMRGYNLPDEVVEWPDFAVYVVVQNLDDVPGTFKIRYTCIGTADKSAAEKYQWLQRLTPEEYKELDIKSYAGSIELYLQPREVGVAICPQSGVNIGSDRVPWWEGGYQVIPGAKN